jgi:hypothetical protein
MPTCTCQCHGPKTPVIPKSVPAAGLAVNPHGPDPGLAHNHYKSDYDRYQSAWHAALCQIEECEQCNALCDRGLILSCDGCSRVHHTDWLGWQGHIDENGGCTLLCPECLPK